MAGQKYQERRRSEGKERNKRLMGRAMRRRAMRRKKEGRKDENKECKQRRK